MRDQATEQEKVLLQIRNVFFDAKKSKFTSGYDPRRRGVLCWLTSGTEKKEVKINVCVYILDIARNMAFAACFRGCGSILALRYGNLTIAKQHFKCSFAKRHKNGVPKWCVEKTTPIFMRIIKKKNEEKFWDDHDPQPIMEPKQGQPSSSTDRLEWCGASHFQGRGEVCLKGSF